MVMVGGGVRLPASAFVGMRVMEGRECRRGSFGLYPNPSSGLVSLSPAFTWAACTWILAALKQSVHLEAPATSLRAETNGQPADLRWEIRKDRVDPAWSIENHVDVTAEPTASRVEANQTADGAAVAQSSRRPALQVCREVTEVGRRLEQDDREPIIATLDLLHNVQQPSE